MELWESHRDANNRNIMKNGSGDEGSDEVPLGECEQFSDTEHLRCLFTDGQIYDKDRFRLAITCFDCGATSGSWGPSRYHSRRGRAFKEYSTQNLCKWLECLNGPELANLARRLSALSSNPRAKDAFKAAYERLKKLDEDDPVDSEAMTSICRAISEERTTSSLYEIQVFVLSSIMTSLIPLIHEFAGFIHILEAAHKLEKITDGELLEEIKENLEDLKEDPENMEKMKEFHEKLDKLIHPLPEN